MEVKGEGKGDMVEREVRVEDKEEREEELRIKGRKEEADERG